MFELLLGAVIIPPLPNPGATAGDYCALATIECAAPIAGGRGATIEAAAIYVRLLEGTQVGNALNVGYVIEPDALYAAAGAVEVIPVCVDEAGVATLNGSSAVVSWTEWADVIAGDFGLVVTDICAVGSSRQLATVATVSEDDGGVPVLAGFLDGITTYTYGFTWTVQTSPDAFTAGDYSLTKTWVNKNCSVGYCTGWHMYEMFQDPITGALSYVDMGVAVEPGSLWGPRYENGTVSANFVGFLHGLQTETRASNISNLESYHSNSGNAVVWLAPSHPLAPVTIEPVTFTSLTYVTALEELKFRDIIPGDNLALVAGACTSFGECTSRCSGFLNSIDVGCLFTPTVSVRDTLGAAVADFLDQPLLNDIEILVHNMSRAAGAVSSIGSECGSLLAVTDANSGIGFDLNTCDMPAGVTAIVHDVLTVILLAGLAYSSIGLVTWGIGIRNPFRLGRSGDMED